MADPPDQPDWDLLPNDPAGFFRLGDSFDRRELKRAYNRLLRQFKPEKHPAEFQRIRAAYEELDEDLRYHGGQTRQRVPVPQDWKTEEFADSPAKLEGPAKPSSVSLVDRLKTDAPAAIFAELKAKRNKTPYDFYSLAILSDVVEKSATGFAGWLIEGVAAHPREGAFKQLLHEYFRSPTLGGQAGKLLLKLLPALARAERTDSFYPLTEPAWQVVLQECRFDEFTAAFEACEAELRDSHIVGRMAFLIQILKSAAWRDPDSSSESWSARQFAYIEENFEAIPPWLEWDVDLLGLAREYLAVRNRFAAGSPLRTRMDAALQDYFSEPQEVGDRSVLACQMEILNNSDALLHEFPIDQADLFSQFYPVWAWATHDVAERQSIEQQTEVNENIWASRANALLARLEKACNNSWTGMKWSACLGLRIVVLAVAVVFLAIFLTFALAVVPYALESWISLKQIENLQGPLMMVSIGLAIFLGWKLRPRLDQKLWFPLNGEFATQCYRNIWRREVFDFQKRSHVPDQFFRAVFAHFAGKSATATWVNEFVQQDYAPALLASAQRFEA